MTSVELTVKDHLENELRHSCHLSLEPVGATPYWSRTRLGKKWWKLSDHDHFVQLSGTPFTWHHKKHLVRKCTFRNPFPTTYGYAQLKTDTALFLPHKLCGNFPIATVDVTHLRLKIWSRRWCVDKPTYQCVGVDVLACFCAKEFFVIILTTVGHSCSHNEFERDSCSYSARNFALVCCSPLRQIASNELIWLFLFNRIFQVYPDRQCWLIHNQSKFRWNRVYWRRRNGWLVHTLTFTHRKKNALWFCQKVLTLQQSNFSCVKFRHYRANNWKKHLTLKS